ncbi:hypothetical protein [Weissella viridescens]|uniref:hypothetical protein n=1 Tax=Weissella viridescens TaxID=1629 RepID=UPI001D0861E9|nr:hypothetical protein [Weissella viridescens]MCB6840243.1 hypothetical protein [Weissella viridescens]MCB6846975.1 hypothetical protein [Weissella viridescens]
MGETASFNFSKFQLMCINGDKGPVYIEPRSEMFSELDDFFYFEKEPNTLYTANVRNNKNYLFIDFRYGRSEPRAEKVIDLQNKQERVNPRHRSEAELRQQLFVYYDFQLKVLYISNQNRKNLILEILEDKLKYKFIIKTIYSDMDTFIKKINSVKEIQFTSTDDIFSQDSKKREALVSLTGVNAPTRVTLKTDYKKNVLQQLKMFLDDLVRESDEYKLEGLVVKGKDDGGFEQTFNADSLVSKIKINVKKDENGIVDPANVLTKIRAEVRTGD